MVRQIRGTVNYVELIGWVGDEPEQRAVALRRGEEARR